MKTFLTFSIINLIFINEINAICGNYDNSEWKISGTNCGKFCADLLTPEMVCDPKLENLGCFCKDGYYRDKNLQCVLPDECGKELMIDKPPPPDFIECPYNEQYDNCSSRCLELCRNREDPISCPINCDTGCFCRGSRLRNNDGLCVPITECEPLEFDRPKVRCPYGEMFLQCGNRCKELCPNTKMSFGMSIDCTKCETGCFCQPGFLRGTSGACLAKRKCDRRSVLGSILSTIFDVIFGAGKKIKAKFGFGR